MALQDIMLRLGLAILAGGVIGAEREAMRRPAGLRTHMLVAVGAALVMLLGEYVFEMYEGRADVDPTRLGAQVISGIGFLGAGTIMREGLSPASALRRARGSMPARCSAPALSCSRCMRSSGCKTGCWTAVPPYSCSILGAGMRRRR